MKKLISKGIIVVLALGLILSGNAYAADDMTPPSVIITGIPSGLVIDQGDSITLNIYFSDNQELSSAYLQASDVILNGFTANKSIQVSGSMRIVTLTNIQGTAGNKTVTLASGVAEDASGNTSLAVTTRAFTLNAPVVVDNTRPTVTVTGITSGLAIEQGGTLSFNVNFSDNIAVTRVNFSAEDVTLNGFTANRSISGTGNTRTVTLTNIRGTVGNKTIAIAANAAEDAAGNTSLAVTTNAFALRAAVIVDITPPTVIITGINSGLALDQGATLSFNVNLSDNIAVTRVDLSADDIILNGFTANRSISGTGNVRTVTLTNIRGAVGNKTVTIASGVALDAAGNRSLAVTTRAFLLRAAVVVDNTPPTVILTGITSGLRLRAGDNLTVVLHFSDNLAVTRLNLSVDDIILHGFTATKRLSGSGLSERTLILTNIQGTLGADKYITVRAGVALDAAGNRSLEVDSRRFEIIATPIPNPTPTPTPTPTPAPRPTVRPVKDVSPNTGSAVDYTLVASVVSVLSLAGIGLTKKYTANNCK